MSAKVMIFLPIAMLFAAPQLGNAHPAVPGFSVVELFTSQGCSSCPPANANLALISERPDVIALSFGVTYWDQLGWKDTFAQPAFTQRQVDYARSLKHDAPATPEIVVDGQADVVGNDRTELERLIARSRLVGPPLTVDHGVLGIGEGPAGAAADVWLVRYDPRVVQVPVRAGENNGKTLAHKNVVKSLARLGEWRGHAAHFTLPPAEPGLSSVVIVQTVNAGHILAATRL